MTIDRCDVCSKPLSAHTYGSGVAICPGIYAAGYRSTLQSKVAEQQAKLDKYEETLRRRNELIEAAYREGWESGYATGDAGGRWTACSDDWERSNAASSIAREALGEGE